MDEQAQQTQQNMAQQPQQGLQVTNAGTLAGRAGFTVGDLEAALLALFPAEDACEWDNTGLLVGDPRQEFTGVAIALDPTVSAVRAAHEAGANVLLTHHPVFLDPPAAFWPIEVPGHDSAGAVVYEALRLGVNCINFHTALDFSAAGLAVLPNLLRLQAEAPFEPFEDDPTKGFGMLCGPGEEDLNLERLAARCVAVFGRLPRVWGNPQAHLERIVCSGGSAGDALDHCLSDGVDCLVCGELKYHPALDAAQAGLCIIELGHDVSELPLTSVLLHAVVQLGLSDEQITMLNQNDNWHTPESMRR